MTTMDNDRTHDRIVDRLSDYADGGLEPHRQSEVALHIASCSDCRVAVAELRAVAQRAGSLTDTPPAEDLWPGIAARLDGGRSGHEARLQRQPSRRFSFTLPQLAAAGIALMVLSGGMVWMAQSGDPRADFPAISADVTPAGPRQVPDALPASDGDAQYEGAVEDLERTLVENRARLDPETVRILERNMQSIDEAIAQSRRALDADPANAFLTSHLAAARQRKIALLRRATALTAGS